MPPNILDNEYLIPHPNILDKSTPVIVTSTLPAATSAYVVYFYKLVLYKSSCNNNNMLL